MIAQVRRHCFGVLEQAGKDTSIGSQNRILLIENIKRRRAVICVNHYLDAVAHVIDGTATETVMGRIRIVVRCRERIHDPRKAAIFTENDLRILLESKEGRQGCGATAHGSAHEKTAL